LNQPTWPIISNRDRRHITQTHTHKTLLIL